MKQIVPDAMIRANAVRDITTEDGQTISTEDGWTIYPYTGEMGRIEGYYADRRENRGGCCRNGVVIRVVVFAHRVVAVTLIPSGDADFVREA